MLDETKKAAHYEKRFGIIAIEKGFITQEELIHALTTQVREDIEYGTHRLVGELFFDLKMMDKNQIEEVVKEIILSAE
jgi:hypothetical protein